MGTQVIFFLLLSVAVIIHEFGHYLFARFLHIGIYRASLFFNPLVTFLMYDPRSGRLSVISEKVTADLRFPDGTVRKVRGEKSQLSIQLTRPTAPDMLLDTQTGHLTPVISGTLIGKTVVKAARRNGGEHSWHDTQYCIGWLPFGGYVSLDGNSLQIRRPSEQLAVNAAGVLFNLIAMILALTAVTLLSDSSGAAASLLYTFAYICFGLMWLNILPLPGLDGGGIIVNLLSMIKPGIEKTRVLRRVYNIIGTVVFIVIISSWFRPASGLERIVIGFFDSMFTAIASLWGI